jgi:hypothetical protein
MADPGEPVSTGELQRTLARIEAGQVRVVEDHEARLRRVERWMYTVPPTIVVSATAIIIAIVRGGP